MLPARSDRGRLAPTAFLVAAALGVGSLAPVLRDSLVASRLGASNASDAYFLATYVMLMVVTILVADSFTPASVVGLSTPDEDVDGIRLHHAFMIAAAGLAVVAALVMALANPIVALTAPGFDDATRTVAVDATRVVTPGVVLLGLAWLVTSYLNAAGYFILPAMITPIVAVGAAIPLVAGTRSPVVAAAGWTLGAAMALAILLSWAIVVGRRERMRQSVVARVNLDSLRTLLPNAAPLLILVMVTQSAEIVDRVIPSGLEVGALTTVALAKKTMNLPHTVLIAAVGAVTLPFISRESGAGRPGRAFVEAINLALFFLLPASAMLVIARSEVVTVLFGRGEFASPDIHQTASLLGVYSIALVPITLGVILQRSFSTIGRSWDPLPLYGLAIAVYIAGAWLGTRWLGLIALPIAFTLVQGAYVAALIVKLKRYATFKPMTLAWPAGLALMASALAALTALGVATVMPEHAWLRAATLASVTMVVYFALVIWFRHPVANDVIRFLTGSDHHDRTGLRVGIDATYAARPNGTGRYLSALIDELDQRSDIELACFRSPRSERLPRFLRLPLNGTVHVIWTQFVLPISVWRQQVDLIHTSMVGPLVTPCPQVLTIHDGLDFRPQWRPSAVWSAYVRLFGALAARRAAAVVTVSHASADDVAHYFRVSPDRLHVVWNGARLLAVDGGRSPVFGLNPGRYVLVVGSSARYKNHETALQAVEAVRDQIPDMELVLVGNGLEHFTTGRSWIHAPGAVADRDLGWLYEHAGLCCVPSLHEGFGLPVVEALIYGVPVVASDIPALREVGGEGARFADPLNAEAFAQAMIDIIEHQETERARIAPEAARAAARTWQRAASEIVDVYTSVVDLGEDGPVWAAGSAS